MNAIFKAFLGVFLIFSMTVIAAGILNANIDAKNANLFMTDAITAVEQSNFSDSVIAHVKEQATEAGYELAVEKVSKNKHTTSAKLSLSYNYQIPILAVDGIEKSIIGYAR